MSSSFELAGSVSDFDANAFRSKLAVLANANEEDVQLSVQSGSVLVDAQMVYADSFMAQSTSESLISMSAVHLSTALAVEVVVAPQVCFRTGCPNSGFPPTARPPSTASAPALPYVWNSMLWARTQVSVEMQALAAPSPPPLAPPLLTKTEFLVVVLAAPLGCLSLLLAACVFCRLYTTRRKTHPAELPALAVHHRQYLGSHQPQANHEQWRTPQRVRVAPKLPLTHSTARDGPVTHSPADDQPADPMTSASLPNEQSKSALPGAHHCVLSSDALPRVVVHHTPPVSPTRCARGARKVALEPLRAAPALTAYPLTGNVGQLCIRPRLLDALAPPQLEQATVTECVRWDVEARELQVVVKQARTSTSVTWSEASEPNPQIAFRASIAYIWERLQQVAINGYAEALPAAQVVVATLEMDAGMRLSESSRQEMRKEIARYAGANGFS